MRDARVPGLSRNLLWAMAAALLDIDWRELPADVRASLLTDVTTRDRRP